MSTKCVSLAELGIDSSAAVREAAVAAVRLPWRHVRLPWRHVRLQCVDGRSLGGGGEADCDLLLLKCCDLLKY